MSTLNKASYIANYATNTGPFKDNSTRNITPQTMRNFSQDNGDSLMFLTDHAYESFYAVASGTDTYTATVNPTINAYTDRQRFYIRFQNANTGPSTINLNGLGAKSIKKNGGSDLAANDIKANQILILVYDGTNFQVVGGGGGGASVGDATETEKGIVQLATQTQATDAGNATSSDGANHTAAATPRAFWWFYEARRLIGLFYNWIFQFVSESGTSHTFTLNDAGKEIQYTNSSAITVTIPNDTTINFPIGTRIRHRMMGTGTVTLVAGSGVTLQTADSQNLNIAKQYGFIDTVKVAANTWMVDGDSSIREANENVKGKVNLTGFTPTSIAANAVDSNGASHTSAMSPRSVYWFWDIRRLVALFYNWIYNYVDEPGTSHTFTASDSGKIINYSSSSAVTVTIPNDTTLNYAIGTRIRHRRVGTGLVTLAPASGVTFRTADSTNLSIRKQYEYIDTIKTAANTWQIDHSTSSSWEFFKTQPATITAQWEIVGTDNSNATYCFVLKNLSGGIIARFRNDQVFEIGGAGASLFEFNIETTVSATSGATTTIGSFPIASNYCSNVEVSWVASAPDGNCAGGVVHHTIKNLSGTTSAVGTQTAVVRSNLTSAPSVSIVANDTTDAIDFNFTNGVSPDHRAYKVNMTIRLLYTTLGNVP